jgi:glycosyltransferase involved in cell wall biosynthesis
MRVVIVSKALLVRAYRGKLAELARLPGVELTAVVPPSWRDNSGVSRLEPGPESGYRLQVAPLALNGQYHLHFYPTLPRLLRQLQPDILHMDEEPYNLATWLGLRAGGRAGCRSAFFTWQNIERRYPWPFSHFEASNYRRTSLAISGSATAASVLRNKGFLGPISVIPQFGVDPAVFAPKSEQGEFRPPSRGSQLAIGFAGRLVPEKGVDVLLRACAALPEGTWSLSILGQGPERERLRNLADQLGIDASVRFHSPRSSEEMPAFYHSVDVLVLPSLSRPNWIEQFGRVLIEAMACGVAVIGSRCGEIPSVIGDAGLVVPEGDPPALQDALLTLLHNRDRLTTLARLGRDRVLGHYTQSQIALATWKAYRTMLGESQSSEH